MPDGRLVRIADFDMLEIHANAAVDDYAHLRAAGEEGRA